MNLEGKREIYWKKLQSQLAGHPSLEERLETLRRFTRSMQREIQGREQAGVLSHSSLFEELTLLAEAVLQGSYEMRLEELRKEASLSVSSSPGYFAIVAIGKFGGRELTYHSDLDILFLLERSEDKEFYYRLGTRIISALSLITREGYAYQIDSSLRPSGQRGALISTLEAFEEYHRELGRIWERQALIKARPVVGDPEFLKAISQKVEPICYQQYEASKIAAEIHHIRSRMEKEIAKEKAWRYNIKTGYGGLVDIEFTTQFLQLLHGKDHRQIRTSNTLEALQRLGKEGLLKRGVAEELRETYLFYRRLETSLRRLSGRPTDELMEGHPELPEYLKKRERVRLIYEEIVR